ncbi:MAG: sigma-70 family RNA polymerase sigma factor [Gemmataceae bacterium]|nr:sigma-70 family RNA polymerase sigma factor [Gemmataceae bacterium]
MESADHVLMERWRLGDVRAFEALVRRWEGPVARFLARYGSDRDSAADATQEVFLRVFRSGSSYQPRTAFSTWLFQIALNVARDAARRRRIPAMLPEHLLTADADPSAAVAKREAAAAVDRALAELPEPLRLVLVLRHYQGMSFAEISRVCDVPATTLKSRFAAALDRLRKSLGALKPDYKESEP